MLSQKQAAALTQVPAARPPLPVPSARTAVAQAAGGSLAHAVKLNAYLTDLGNFPIVNEVMVKHVPEPFPARAAVGISELPKGALVEIEGILELD